MAPDYEPQVFISPADRIALAVEKLGTGCPFAAAAKGIELVETHSIPSSVLTSNPAVRDATEAYLSTVEAVMLTGGELACSSLDLMLSTLKEVTDLEAAVCFGGWLYRQPGGGMSLKASVYARTTET